MLKCNDEITLLNLGNIIIRSIENKSNTIIATPNFDGDFKTTKYKLSWLSIEDVIDLTINEYDHILNTPKLTFLENGEIDSSCINKNSKMTMHCYGENALKLLPEKTHIQLLRRGYHIINNNDENNMILNRLPDVSKKINHLSIYAKK